MSAPRVILFLLLFFISFPVSAAEKRPSAEREETLRRLSKDLGSQGAIELKALEIRAKIYEPQVIYVLDRAKIDVDLKEEDVHFSPRTDEPVLDNTL